MKIFKVKRKDTVSYDEYDSFICYSNNEESARNIHPEDEWKYNRSSGVWINKEDCYMLSVIYIGENKDITEESVILSSFNAG